MAVISINSFIIKAVKLLLDIAIGIYFILLLMVIITGGVEITLLGVSIKAHHLYTPIKFLIPLVTIRLLITIKFKNFLLMVVSILLCLIVIETGVQIWNPQIAKPEMRQLHKTSPYFGYDLVPGTYGVGFMGESYQINSHGFRGREFRSEKKSGLFRIMVIGDSFTFGARVNQEDTYPAQLEEALRRMNKPCEVINCGIIGHNMWQHYEVLKRKVLPFHPDLVILGLFEDDLLQSVSPRQVSAEYKGANPFEERSVTGILGHFSIWNFLKNANAIYEYKFRYKRGYSYIKTIEERKKEWGPTNPTNKNYKIMSGKAEKEKYIEFAETLREFVELVDAKGINVLVVIIPDSVQLNEPHLQNVNRLVQKVCNTIKAPFLDTTPLLESEKDYASLYLFPFDAHNSPKGLRLIGQAIADQIMELDLLPSS
jgi:hypothetical protein